MTHSAASSCANFLFLPHFFVMCELLLNRRRATLNPFVHENSENIFLGRCVIDGGRGGVP